MYLPRNVDMLQASELSWLSSPPLYIEVPSHKLHWVPWILADYSYDHIFLQMEENLVRGRLKGITAYFGEAPSGLCMGCSLN